MAKKREILELSQIHKGFRNNNGELKVLDSISLTVRAGEISALMGPSGCGKSTLLNIVAGLIEPDQGEAKLNPSTRLAYIFQEPRLLPWKTVEENLSFMQDNFLSEAEAREIRENLLQKTGLLAYKDVYPAQLSGGMKQRLEIVRALAIKPQLLLMDEPFKSLDLALQYQLQKLVLAEHTQYNFAILFITHNPQEAVMLSDRVVVFSGKPARVEQELTIDLPRDMRSMTNPQLSRQAEKVLNILLRK